MKDITKKYKKGDLTVVWQPSKCMHSTKCFRGLPTVFDPSVRPWITPDNATEEEIMAQIDKCPSGALSYITDKQTSHTTMEETTTSGHITIAATGPYLVKGNITLTDDKGNVIEKKENFALCRCGLSKNKPFCDGSHRQSTDWLNVK